ncbi:MAG TPA: DUF4350 domain-containing protein [Verrucomicrobiae bacterium]|nr:DUF4350 domain-containing protein [Verrucomicrobiae bacterium]
MSRTGSRLAMVAGAVLIASVAVAVLFFSKSAQPYDRSFDTRVTNPAYRADGPVVLFGEGHLNIHTSTEDYKPFADLLRADGYTLRVSQQPLTAPALVGVSVLILAAARGANDANDAAAYSEAEGDVVEAWVRGGGSLLLVTDHWPFGAAASSLARRFDVTLGAGLVQDEAHDDPARGDSHLVFSEDNGLLRDHPILHGRSEAERVRRVLTFTGSSVQGPSGAVPFLALSDTATERPPGPPRVERDGGDVRVSMEYGAPASAAGRAQGLALEVQAGRVVVLGEAGMLRAQRERDGTLVGMNVPGYDNRQLALNIMHWLSRVV